MQSLRNIERLVHWVMGLLSLGSGFLGIIVGASTLLTASSTPEVVQAESFLRAGEYLLIALLSNLTARVFWREDRWVL